MGLAGAYGGQTSIYGVNVRNHVVGCYAGRFERDLASPYVAVDALYQAGVRDYSIHLEPESGRLFATLWRTDDHRMDDLPNLPVMKRWWAHMADLMQTEPSGAPVQTALIDMFHLE